MLLVQVINSNCALGCHKFPELTSWCCKSAIWLFCATWEAGTEEWMQRLNAAQQCWQRISMHQQWRGELEPMGGLEESGARIQHSNSVLILSWMAWSGLVQGCLDLHKYWYSYLCHLTRLHRSKKPCTRLIGLLLCYLGEQDSTPPCPEFSHPAWLLQHRRGLRLLKTLLYSVFSVAAFTMPFNIMQSFAMRKHLHWQPQWKTNEEFCIFLKEARPFLI